MISQTVPLNGVGHAGPWATATPATVTVPCCSGGPAMVVVVVDAFGPVEEVVPTVAGGVVVGPVLAVVGEEDPGRLDCVVGVGATLVVDGGAKVDPDTADVDGTDVVILPPPSCLNPATARTLITAKLTKVAAEIAPRWARLRRW